MSATEETRYASEVFIAMNKSFCLVTCRGTIKTALDGPTDAARRKLTDMTRQKRSLSNWLRRFANRVDQNSKDQRYEMRVICSNPRKAPKGIDLRLMSRFRTYASATADIDA